MQQNKKQPYLAPAVKVVSYKVEIGQAGSPSNLRLRDNEANQQVNISDFTEGNTTGWSWE